MTLTSIICGSCALNFKFNYGYYRLLKDAVPNIYLGMEDIEKCLGVNIM